jgi:hypothetical protein
MCVRDLRQVGVFFLWLLLITSTNKTTCHDIAELLLKVTLNIISLAYIYLQLHLIDVQYIKCRPEHFPSELKTYMGEMISILVHKIGKSTYFKKITPGASQVMGGNCHSLSISRQ